MIQHANVIARAAMAGGLVGACLVVAAPAQASPWGHHGNHNNNTNTTNTNTTNTNTTNSPSNNAAVTAAATTAADPPAPPIPTGVVVPFYGNYFNQLGQSTTGLGVNPHTCPAAGSSAASCYQPINTAPLFPVSGTVVTSVAAPTTKTTVVNGTTTVVPTTTILASATVPTSANVTFPFVTNANGTGSSIQLPTFGFG